MLKALRDEYPWLYYLAAKYAAKTGIDFDDLVSVGCESIANSLLTHDDTKGASLEYWIELKCRYAIIDFVRHELTEIRLLSLDYWEQMHPYYCPYQRDILAMELADKQLAKLKDNMRERCLMWAMGYTLKSIADFQGVTEGAISIALRAYLPGYDGHKDRGGLGSANPHRKRVDFDSADAE